MKTVDAHLCIRCKNLLNASGLYVIPLYEMADEPQECPWCQREKTLMKYRIKTTNK